MVDFVEILFFSCGVAQPDFRGSSDTLSPASFTHSLTRVRASSAEPEPNLSHSLSISGSPKVPFASRIRRQPTVDTYSFTKEEFEVRTASSDLAMIFQVCIVTVLFAICRTILESISTKYWISLVM